MGCSSTKAGSLEERKTNLLIEMAVTQKEISILHLQQKKLEKQGNSTLAQVQEKEKINAIHKLYNLKIRMNEILKYSKTENNFKILLDRAIDKKMSQKDQIKSLKDALKEKAKNLKSQKTLLLLQEKINDLQEQEDALSEQETDEEAYQNVKVDQYIEEELVQLKQQDDQSQLKKINDQNKQLPVLQFPELSKIQFKALPNQVPLDQNASIRNAQYA